MEEQEALGYFNPKGLTTLGGIEAVEGEYGHFGRASCLGLVYGTIMS
jgi:hypothetical protein